MATSRFHSNLLGLLDSESEDDLGAGVRVRTATNMAGAKKGRAAVAGSKVTKPAQKKPAAKTARRASGRLAAIEQEGGRQALADKTNEQPKAAARKKPGRKPAIAPVSPPASDEAPKKGRGRPKKVHVAEESEVPDSARPAKRGRNPAPSKAVVEAPEQHEEETEIPETQEQAADSMDVDQTEDVQMEELPSLRRPEPQSIQKGHSSASVAPVRRAAGANDSDQNDPSLRRRLGDLTKKYESLEVKYRDLREIGIKEAERNFDRLRKQGEEKSKSSSELISSLKSEVAAQKELARDGSRFKKQWEASEEKIDGLQAKITEMTTSLSEAKSEIKALSTKLAAARGTEVPGSALKSKSVESNIPTAQAAQMKEDLYGDLTGLIVRGVKHGAEQDVYDCIQTGRNGTLHFKLSIAQDAGSDNFDEAQFMYMPQLDPSRDQALVEMLPDYLVEEITFPRPHAAKFYARVMKSLTERLE